MFFDIFCKPWIDFIQNFFTVPERPHFSNGLIPDTSNDPSNVMHYKIHSFAFIFPIFRLIRQSKTDSEIFAIFLIGSLIFSGWVVLHIIYSSSDINYGFQLRMRTNILDFFTIHPNFTAVIQRSPIFITSTYHSFTPTQPNLNLLSFNQFNWIVKIDCVLV